MPKKVKKEEKKAHKEIEDRVHKDLIVKSMPSQKKMSGAGRVKKSKEEPSFHYEEKSSTSKNNHKSVGLVIITLGILVVAVVIYFSYQYIIKPEANTTPQTEQTPPTTQTAPPVIEDEPVDEVSEPVDITPDTDTTPIVDLEEIDAPEEEEEAPDTEATPPPLPEDSDFDGLNNDEELILGTNPKSVDSDGDSYGDLSEIRNGYNPTGDGKLVENEKLSTYGNDTIGYSLVYPNAWNIESLNNDYTLVFSTPDDSLVQISAQENIEGQSIMTWYELAFPDETITYDKLKSNDGWEGLTGPNGLNFYLTDVNKTNIYVISFIPALGDRLTYPNIFEMMIDTLLIK